MTAAASFRLIVTRGGIGPALLAGPERVDHVEVVDIDSGEVVLFWDLSPTEAKRRARALRADLDTLHAEDFLARWGSVDT